MNTMQEAFDEEIKKHKLYHPPKIVVEPRERNSKVKVFTNEEIRQKSGLGASPFFVLNDNILWTVINQGPVSLAQTCQYLKSQLKGEINKNTVAATLSQLRLLPYAEIKEEKSGRTFKLPNTLTLETIRTDLHKALAAKRKEYKPRNPKSKPQEKHTETLLIKKAEDAIKNVEDVIENVKESIKPNQSDPIMVLANLLQKILNGGTITITFKKEI